MHFIKMHGTGNDFVLLEEKEPLDYPSLARILCHRHVGIGADGIINILPSQNADFRMRIFNADGSEAEMCGNGIRCASRRLYEKGATAKKKFTIETLAGIMEPECFVTNGKVEKVRVNMGNPRYGQLHPKSGQPLTLKSEHLLIKLNLPDGIVEGASISMGNPHYVIFHEENSRWNMEEHGKTLSVHPEHPQQSNVEFVKILAQNRIRVRVWERGVGPTQACGSGACASFAAARILKGMREKTQVEMPGGVLEVEWDGKGDIFLTGPAATVYEGEISTELLTGLTIAQEKLSGSR